MSLNSPSAHWSEVANGRTNEERDVEERERCGWKD